VDTQTHTQADRDDTGGAHHVPERLCGGPCLQTGAMTSVRPLLFYNIICPMLCYSNAPDKNCTFCFEIK